MTVKKIKAYLTQQMHIHEQVCQSATRLGIYREHEYRYRALYDLMEWIEAEEPDIDEEEKAYTYWWMGRDE